ncbi:MAG: DUF192 domain-containing protein [Polyangiaceae bacterium]|nr:DUF192 domain-containing protein [Polyangiaceae bacterium]
MLSKRAATLGFVAGCTIISLIGSLIQTSCDRQPEGTLVNRTQLNESHRASHSSDPENQPTPNSAGAKNNSIDPNRCLVPTPEQPPPSVGPAASCPLDPEFGVTTLAKGRVTFVDAPDAPTIEVELARTPHEKERGLMFRKSMSPDAGMLFDFPGHPRVQSFWMQNTCIPLDMLFITHDGFIAGILENVPTLNRTSRSIRCPVNYVLEVNAGWTRKHKVYAGQSVKLPVDG